MKLGIPKELRTNETRVACTPDILKKLVKKGLSIIVEHGAGAQAGYPDALFQIDGVELGDANQALGADIIFKIHPPTADEVSKMKKGALLLCHIDPFDGVEIIQSLAKAGVNCVGMELIPRTSRAQSMDSLSSQANIAGYRAVLEATEHYPRFFPMMMTSAGSAKPAHVVVLGAGVAGLQAIATARRLGANVFGYDIRPEVREQIESLGAKFIEIEVGEAGSGVGGYAKELSEEGKKKQQALLSERLQKADIIITTANIPGRKAPILVSEEVVKGMRAGSVIVDMAAANGGNCACSEPNKVVVKHDVTIVGKTNYPGLMPADSSSFYGRNLMNLLDLFLDSKKDEAPNININLEDDIIEAALVTHNGEALFPRKGTV